MGIHGLTTLMDDNLHLLKDHKLHDTKVIVDGNNLFHLLYYSYNVDFAHGGDYDKFSRKIKEFFEILKSCNIEAYIIMDGGYEPDDRKLKTILERSNNRIHMSGLIGRSLRGKILPVLAYEVFINTLDSLHVHHVTCDFEADDQIAVLANDFRCPVISFDSDFYILNLTNGFIPFDSVNFEVQPILKEDNGKQYRYLPVRIYFTENFVKCFPELNKEMLPLMATVLGNDYVNIKTFEEFYSSLPVPKSLNSSIVVSKTKTKMFKIVSWLASLKSIENGVDQILMSAKPEQRENVKKLIEKSIDAYSKIHTYSGFSLFDFFTNQQLPLKQSKTVTYHGNSIPSWFIEFHRKGKMPVFMQNTIVLHRNILLCQVENLRMPSSYNCSLSLRQMLYSILLKDDLKMAKMESKSDSKDSCIEEYDRQDELKNLKKNLIQPVLTVEGFGEIPGLTEIEVMECNKKKELMFQIFDFTSNEENRMLFNNDLLLMAIIYWLRHADPQVNVNILKTLIVCWLSITRRNFGKEIEYRDNVLYGAFDKCHLEQREKLRKNVDKYFIAPQHSKKHPMDINVVHAFAQFQACYLSTIHLNQILGYPFQPVNPASLFNGSFLYNFCTDLQSRTNPDLFIAEMLIKQSPVLSLYHAVVSTVLSKVDESCFVESSTSSKKTRKRRNKPSAKSEETDTSSEKIMDDNNSSDEDTETCLNIGTTGTKFTAMCEVSNRFNFLGLNDE